MADITKCKGNACKMKESCYRYTAKASETQLYFIKPPIKNGKCDMFWGDGQKQIMNQLQKIVNGK